MIELPLIDRGFNDGILTMNSTNTVAVANPTAPPTRVGIFRYFGMLTSITPVQPMISAVRVNSDGLVKNAATTQTAIAMDNRKLNLN